MNKKIEMPNSSLVYYINEDKRTVVCKMTEHKNDWCYNSLQNQSKRFIFKKIKKSYGNYQQFDPFDAFETIVDNGCRKHIKSEYTGIAKCSQEDHFNEKVGMKIARNRALKAYYADMRLVTEELLSSLDIVYDAIGDLDDECLSRCERYESC